MDASEIFDRLPPEKLAAFKEELHLCMFISDVHKVAQKFGQELTDEQARAILEGHGSEEVSAHVLEEVTGGANNVNITYVNRGLPELPPLWRG